MVGIDGRLIIVYWRFKEKIFFHSIIQYSIENSQFF